MPNIYQLNPPPHPFFDFLGGFENHPWFAARGFPAAYAAASAAEAEQEERATQTQAPKQPAADSSDKAGEKAKAKGADVEDPPEVDPSTMRPEGREMPFRGRGRWGRAFEDGADEPRRKHPCRGRFGNGPGRPDEDGHHRGPPPFMFGPRGPWWAARGPPPHEHGWPGHEHERPEGGPPSPPPPPPPGHGPGHGPGHHPGHHPAGPPHHPGPHHHHHHGPPPPPPPPPGPHGPHGPRGFRGPPPHCRRRRDGPPGGFDVPQFLKNMSERLGIDLTEAASGLGLDRFTSPRGNRDNDFDPRADIFDAENLYLIHVSLPGAKKEDVGVDWDSEKSHLRIAGVVHRPGVDEKLMSKLIVDGRKREVGAFEKIIRLGTKAEPANIDVAAITAKMIDGVLVVRVPQLPIDRQRREVPIDQSTSPSPVRNTEKSNEKSLLFDADEDMYDAPANSATTKNVEKTENSVTTAKPATKDFEKLALHEKALPLEDDRSETVDYEERLPHYTPPHVDYEEAEAEEEEEDWEKYNTDEEGEYVKINVD